MEEVGRLRHSNHSMILVTVAVKADAKATAQPDWNKADWVKMREELAKVDWRGQMEGRTGQEAWDLLKKKIHLAVDKYRMSRTGGQGTRTIQHGSLKTY